MWNPSRKSINLLGTPATFFNAGGIVFYHDIRDNIEDVSLGMALLTARSVAQFLPRLTLQAASGVQLVKFERTARVQQHFAIATLLGVMAPGL
jgi:hypothetical protein